MDGRSSARGADIVVRTWRRERDRRIVIVLDTGRTSAGRVGGIPRLDPSMDAALLLTAVAVRAGDRADLIAPDRRGGPRGRRARPGVGAAGGPQREGAAPPKLPQPELGPPDTRRA